MRVLISKTYDGLKKNIDLLGTDKLPKRVIVGHQMVLAKWNGKWWLINGTYYRPRSKDKLVPKYEILDEINGRPVDPASLLYQKIKLPGMANTPEHHSLVLVGIGKDRYDDLGLKNWENVMRVGLSIPVETFKALPTD